MFLSDESFALLKWKSMSYWVILKKYRISFWGYFYKTFGVFSYRYGEVSLTVLGHIVYELTTGEIRLWNKLLAWKYSKNHEPHVKALLHYGDNCDKLVHFKEQKIFFALKNPSLEQYLPWC